MASTGRSPSPRSGSGCTGEDQLPLLPQALGVFRYPWEGDVGPSCGSPRVEIDGENGIDENLRRPVAVNGDVVGYQERGGVGDADLARDPYLPVPFRGLCLRTQIALVDAETDVHPLDLLDGLRLLHERRGNGPCRVSLPASSHPTFRRMYSGRFQSS